MKYVYILCSVRQRSTLGLVALCVLLTTGVASAQNGDMFIYPSKGQSQAQQDKDRYECHTWAVQQTGFDPSAPQAANAQTSQQYQPSKPHVLQGAGRGAAMGAVGGAIAGNAGKGAAANIFVNAIACGGVLTPPFEAYLAKATEEQKRNLFQTVPLGRIGMPEEYASLAVYLASDQHYIVGQVISPNGGLVI